MLIQALAVVNFLVGVFDTWLTQRRIKDYGPNVEMNRLVRWLATHLGPELGALIGVLGPVTGWTYGLLFFNIGLPLAFLTGYNCKRFFIQLTSIELERDARVHNLLKELGATDMNSGGNSNMSQTDENTSRLHSKISRKEK